MIHRQIFPELKLLKKDVLERFLLTLYEVYRMHPVYPYDPNHKEDYNKSKILIYPSYAKIDYFGKQPKVVVKMGAYSFSGVDTFFNDASGEYRDENDVFLGWVHEKMMNTSITIIIHSQAEEEASDIADELALLLSYGAKSLFSEVGLIIRAVQVSETDIQDTEKNIYQTMIGVNIEFSWKGIIATKKPIQFGGVDINPKYQLLKPFDSTRALIYFSDVSGIYPEQLISLKKGDEEEWIFVKRVFEKNDLLEVQRGVFATTPLDIPETELSEVVVTPYQTAILYPKNTAYTDVGKTVHSHLDTELQTKYGHAKRFPYPEMIYVSDTLEIPIVSHEKMLLVSVPSGDRLVVERGKNNIRLALPQYSVVYWRQNEPLNSPYRAPGVHVELPI